MPEISLRILTLWQIGWLFVVLDALLTKETGFLLDLWVTVKDSW
ncbi:hypothetical protein [Microcoleus sp. B4-D4]